jgi:hypothetical protein
MSNGVKQNKTKQNKSAKTKKTKQMIFYIYLI